MSWMLVITFFAFRRILSMLLNVLGPKLVIYLHSGFCFGVILNIDCL